MILRPSRSTLFPYTTLFRSLALPSIQKQANDLIVDIPKYVEQIGGDIQNITDDSFLESTYDKGYEWVQSTLSDVPNAIKNYRSEEHTSELQSRGHLVCRLLLEKKKKMW